MTCASSLLSCDVLFRIEYKYKVIASLMRWDLHDTFPGKDSYLQACAIASARVISIWVGLPFIFITEFLYCIYVCYIDKMHDICFSRLNCFSYVSAFCFSCICNLKITYLLIHLNFRRWFGSGLPLPLYLEWSFSSSGLKHSYNFRRSIVCFNSL